MTLFLGLDIQAQLTVLMTCVSAAASVINTLSMIEKYKEAGFVNPETVIADSEEVASAFGEKIEKIAIQRCALNLVKMFQRDLKDKRDTESAFTKRQTNEFINQLRKLLSGRNDSTGLDKDERAFAEDFNQFYVSNESQHFKKTCKKIYKLKKFYAYY